MHVAGLVQGVGYRYGTYREAKSLSLGGWVRNLADGRVEALFEGKQSALDRMLEWCGHGPGLSRVDSMECVWDECSESFHEFEIRF